MATTYAEAVARARKAYNYGQVKTAGNNDYNGDVWAQQAAAQGEAWERDKQKADFYKQVRQLAFDGNENGIVELAARAPKEWSDNIPGIISQVKRIQGQHGMNQYALEDPQGAAISVPIGEEAGGVAAMKENRKAIDAENERLAKNRNWGIGAGVAGGLGVGAGAYGLMGLFPSLRKRRLLRALIALGAGGAAGAGIGYAVNKNLDNGKIQGAYAEAKGRAGAALDALKGGAKA